MRVLVNGFPKCGTHAAVKACSLLGVYAEHEHRPFALGLPEGVTHHVFVKRDPRNALISRLRMQGEVVTSARILEAFRQYGVGTTMEQAMAEYIGWLTAPMTPMTLVLRYEDLIREAYEMHRLASYLGVWYRHGAFRCLPGGTKTWNERASDYREYWTPAVAIEWAMAGGLKLLSDWGYN